MSTPRIRRTATVDIDGDTFVVAPGSTCTLDSSAVPYASADITLPLLGDALIDWLNPFDGRRVPVNLTIDGVSRTFDLGLRNRVVDHTSKQVTLTLASDEAMLARHAVLSPDTGARAHEASLRAVTNYVLGKVGASLEAGTDDANVTAYWEVSNQFANPGTKGGISPWTSGGNCTLFQSGPWSPATPLGVNAAGFNSVASGPLAVTPFTTTGPSVTPGKSYVISGYGRRAGAPARSMSARIRWLNQAGMPVGPDVLGTPVALTDTGWTLASCIAVAPAGAVRVDAFFYVTGSTAGGQIGYVAAAAWHEGNEVVPPFDGDTTDTAQYSYAWAGTAYASASIRTPVVERPPEQFVWKPGVSAWDFLMPLTSAAGMVLWCDENRDWFLALPESRTIPTQINVSPLNASVGEDELNADDDTGAVTGIVVHYTWTDDDGISREAYDTAGTSENVATIELTQPYPGPGAATAILARRQGTGRIQRVEAIGVASATPGMSAQISLPGAPDTLGRITAVTFNLDTGFMDLGTSGLVDVPPGSWLDTPAEAWTAPPNPLAWNAWT